MTSEVAVSLKIGPWEFVRGIGRGHFNAVLNVPRGEQGALGGSLASFNELVILAVASFVAAGILMSTYFGGILFDAWKPSARYLLVGIAAGLLAVLALVIYLSQRRSRMRA